jgi:hypothetical protein
MRIQEMSKVFLLIMLWMVLPCLTSCCPPFCMGSGACEGPPPYRPDLWNGPSIVGCNNCYNYGCNIKTNTFAQPGYAHGVSHSLDCPSVEDAAKADGLTHGSAVYCHKCSHKVALVIAPGGGAEEMTDYHWYREDDNSRWSHKPAGYPATELDASGAQITDPETADRRYVGPDYILDYWVFCCYLCVDRDDVTIAGPGSCD